MENKPHIPESVLSRIWKEQRFQPNSLRTTAGHPVQVLRPGRLNQDAGPDYKEALIRIGERVYEGDVELHLEIADWYAHGHDGDPNYNRTVLHVVLWEPSPDSRATSAEIFKADGISVPTVIVQPCLTASLPTLLDYFQLSDQGKQQKLHTCQTNLEEVSLEDLLINLRDLGKQRLYERARRFEQWLQPSASFSDGDSGAFQQLLYEALCEGLGYSSNKEPFVELARRLPFHQIRSHLPKDEQVSPSEPLPWIQAMLFGVSGLLPSSQTPLEPSGSDTKRHPALGKELDADTRDYLAQLQSLWEMLQPCLDATPLAPEAWNFFRLRPANFPTRRIAALSYLIRNYTVQPVFEHYLQLFSFCAGHSAQEAEHIKLLERTLTLSTTDYWKGRYLFGKAAKTSSDRLFLGRSRIRDILMSAVFPVFVLYALRTGQPGLESQILRWYEIFPAPEGNRELKTLHKQLFTHRDIRPKDLRTASLYQGLLHLAKHYCALPDCAECPLAFGTPP